MRITRLTPEQARTAGQMLQRALDWLRGIREQLQALARAAIKALQAFARDRRHQRVAAVRPNRPAWASPYGPPPHRR